MSDNLPAVPDAQDHCIADLERRLAEALATIQSLKEQIEVLQRAGKRQATPFARRDRVKEPQKAGRKPGQGTFTHREKPAVENVTQSKQAEIGPCRECALERVDIREHEQFELDIPKVDVVTTHYLMSSGHCPDCQKRHWMVHPAQISTATGAAGVVIGPRAKALAAALKHRFGAAYEKVCEALHDAFGLKVTRSAWCQAEQRLGEQAAPVSQALGEAWQACAVVHSDETGWRIGVLSAWLWVFTNRQMTVYSIETSRGHAVVGNILGKEFKGVLVSDCFLAYDHQALAAWLKQKCLSHLLKELRETKTRGAVRFVREVTAVLQQALALKAEQKNLTADTFAVHAQAIETRLDALIDVKPQLTDPDNARFVKRIRKHRAHVLRFLYVEGLDATNNQAERMLHPAVITRKTNGCNRTKEDAKAHAILSSVIATCRQQSIPVLDYLIKLQRFGETPPSLIGFPTAPT